MQPDKPWPKPPQPQHIVVPAKLVFPREIYGYAVAVAETVGGTANMLLALDDMQFKNLIEQMDVFGQIKDLGFRYIALDVRGPE